MQMQKELKPVKSNPSSFKKIKKMRMKMKKTNRVKKESKLLF